MKMTRIFALMAVLILAGCREGRDKELPQKPASVDTSEFDEAYMNGCGCLKGCARMWSWISEGGLDFFSIFVLSCYRANEVGQYIISVER